MEIYVRKMFSSNEKDGRKVSILTDFGIMRKLDRTNVTYAHSKHGHDRYRAPEVADQTIVIRNGKKADVFYSLGRVLEFVLGRVEITDKVSTTLIDDELSKVEGRKDIKETIKWCTDATQEYLYKRIYITKLACPFSSAQFQRSRQSVGSLLGKKNGLDQEFSFIKLTEVTCIDNS